MLRYLTIILFIISVSFINNPVSAQDNTEEEWTWRKGTDLPSVKRTRAELDSLLELHRIWADSVKNILYKLNSESRNLSKNKVAYFFDTCRAIGSRLDLRGAHLNKVNLDSVMLNYANLDSVYLEHASLRYTSLINTKLINAKFSYSDLSYSYLRYANLTKANFFRATLDNTNFSRAILKKASFRFADLSNAAFRYADLSDAYLVGGNLSRVSFWRADLQGAYFEPDSLPIIHSMTQALNLDMLTFGTNPSKLKELQVVFSNRGYRKQERKIICAIRRSEKFENDYIKYLDWLMFDYTSEYGSNLNLPWKRLGIIYLICAFLYYVFMVLKLRSGVILIIPGFKNNKQEEYYYDFDEYVHEPYDTTYKFIINIKSEKFKLLWSADYLWVPMWIRLFWWSFFFSAMSTFNIGFRDINFGRWLKMLTRREFDLQPFGWMRVVAGFQALLSVYLLAIWILSFAGTPFK